MLHAYSANADALVSFDLMAPATDPSSILWVDVLHPNREDAAQVLALFGVVIPTLEEMQEIEPSARLYAEDSAEFMTATIVSALDSEDPAQTPVTFILKGTVLITVRHADAAPFQTFLQRKVRSNGHTTGENIMLGVIETIIDRIADALERIGAHSDAVSRDVFRNKTGTAMAKTRDLESVLGRIGREGDLLTKLRDSLVGINRLLTYYSAHTGKYAAMPRDARQTVKMLQRDAQSLTDHASFLSSKINFLLDATLGLINLEQNQIIKIFTVAAVAFLPPTLIASIYGMNFEVMPELRWRYGYPFGIILMVLSAAVPFLYFRKRGWL